MSTYRDLLVWQKSRLLTKEIYTLTAGFPKTEMFGLTTQMRRAAISIMSNLAEGQGRRRSRDQVHFYFIARGSLLELESQLFITADLGYVAEESLKSILMRTEETGRLLNGLIRKISMRDSEARGPRPEA